MKAGTILDSDKEYYTKDGSGIIFKTSGWYRTETSPRDVWHTGAVNRPLSRNIKDIAENEEDAKKINYGAGKYEFSKYAK